ncbi:MAG TPA: hypothetical protein VM681_04600 [Candidatus Thermoplasmatota archaeon]|nr:hypothetical protein [Candidatus Thermoplasmatota archaeon]
MARRLLSVVALVAWALASLPAQAHHLGEPAMECVVVDDGDWLGRGATRWCCKYSQDTKHWAECWEEVRVCHWVTDGEGTWHYMCYWKKTGQTWRGHYGPCGPE